MHTFLEEAQRVPERDKNSYFIFLSCPSIDTRVKEVEPRTEKRGNPCEM